MVRLEQLASTSGAAAAEQDDAGVGGDVTGGADLRRRSVGVAAHLRRLRSSLALSSRSEDAESMREFILLPLVIIAGVALVALALVAAVPVVFLMWLGERSGVVRIGGWQRDD